jgi:ribonuclease BN (tRNA processing enzyme)
VLWGPRGLRAHLHALAAAHGDYVEDPGFALEVVELAGGDVWDDPAGRFVLRTHPTPHTDVSLAARIETADGVVAYTGDTGPSDALGAFFRGASLLISECGYADPPELSNHLSPRSLAALAGAAAPGLLVVTHVYPPLRPHQIPDLVRAAGYPGELVVANHGTTIEVERNRARLVPG